MGQYISGVIMFKETLYQKTAGWEGRWYRPVQPVSCVFHCYR